MDAYEYVTGLEAGLRNDSYVGLVQSRQASRADVSYALTQGYADGQEIRRAAGQ